MKRTSAYAGVLLLVTLSVLMGGSTQAASVRFLQVGANTGFDPATPDFPTVPDVLMGPDGESFPASIVGSGAPVEYSLDHCLLIDGDSDCQVTIPTGTAYTDVVTLTLETTPIPIPDSGLYLVVGGMFSTGYTTTDVWFDTDSAPVHGIPVDPMLYLVLTTVSSEYHYFGVLFEEYGESKTLRYDVDAMLVSGTPIMTTSAYFPVPEPSSASLLLLGLTALVVGRRR